MRTTVAIWVIILAAWTSQATADQPLLADSFVLTGIEGTVEHRPDTNQWVFIGDVNITDGQTTVQAGYPIAFLPSAALEKLIVEPNRLPVRCRLWARVTTYHAKNYLFATYFLVDQTIQASKSQISDLKSQTKEAPVDTKQMKESEKPTAVEEPAESDDPFELPAEVRQKLQNEAVVRPVEQESPKEPAEPKTRNITANDRMMVNRYGFIRRQPDGHFTFVPDGLGHNISRQAYQLLPCRTLESIENRRDITRRRIRYRISGVATTFKGHEYLLLQKATRTYSYGNFQ